jgi:hypothetical protein
LKPPPLPLPLVSEPMPHLVEISVHVLYTSVLKRKDCGQ